MQAVAHNAECRERVYEHIRYTEEGADRILRAEIRLQQGPARKKKDGSENPKKQKTEANAITTGDAPETTGDQDPGEVVVLASSAPSSSADRGPSVEIVNDGHAQSVPGGQPSSGSEQVKKRQAETDAEDSQRAAPKLGEDAVKRKAEDEPEDKKTQRKSDMGSLEDIEAETMEAGLFEICSIGHDLGYDVHVSEILNPGHFCTKAATLGLSPSDAFDLTVSDENGQPSDLNDKTQRKKAEMIIDERRPSLLIGSPTCKAFSQLMTLNYPKMDQKKAEELLEEAIDHLRFTFKLYEKQRKAGQLFLHEHPWSACWTLFGNWLLSQV